MEAAVWAPGINETRRLKELEAQLRKELLELSVKYPRYGYRRIAALRRRQGWRVGKRHIQRLRRAAGLRVPTDEAEDNPA